MRDARLFRAFVVSVFAAFALVAGLPIEQLAHAAIVVVQAGGAGDTNATTITSTGVDTTGATLLVMGCAWYPGITSNVTASDSKTNTWVGLTAREYTGYAKVRWWYVNSATPTVGASHTFTCSGLTTSPTVAYLAASGAHATPFGQESGNFSGQSGCNSGTTCDHGGGFTPAENAEIVLAGFSGSATVSGISIDGGFNTIHIHGNVGGAAPAGFAYLIQTTAAAVNPVWTFTNGGGDVVASSLASFKVALTGPPAGSRGLKGVGR